MRRHENYAEIRELLWRWMKFPVLLHLAFLALFFGLLCLFSSSCKTSFVGANLENLVDMLVHSRNKRNKSLQQFTLLILK